MKKFSLRDVIFYALIFFLLVSTVVALQRMEKQGDDTYANMRTYFEQERVRNFEAEEDKITLVLWDTEENGKPVIKTFPLANLSLFYSDMGQMVGERWRAGIIEDYD